MSGEWLEFALLLCIAVLLPIVPAYVLYKTLPARTTVSGPFKGLNIQLTGSFGGYFLVLIVVVGFIVAQQPPTTLPSPSTTTSYEVWTVTGAATLKNGGSPVILNENEFSVLPPPNVTVYPDGRFDLDVPVKRGQNDKLEFPSIVIAHVGHMPETIHLNNLPPKFGAKNFKTEPDIESKKLFIETKVELEPK